MCWSTGRTASGSTRAAGWFGPTSASLTRRRSAAWPSDSPPLAGRRLDDASPYVDAALPDGTRLHAVLPPVAVGRPCLSLRTFTAARLHARRARGAGTLPHGAALLLRAIVRARLRSWSPAAPAPARPRCSPAMLGLVEPAERLSSSRTPPNCGPTHPHVVRLTARPPNVEGAGEVSLRDLVRQALRMRPDRLVVGEVPRRGGGRAAGRAEHRPRRRRRHRPREQRRASVPARLEALGALGGAGPARACTASWRPLSRSRSISAGTGTAAGCSPRSVSSNGRVTRCWSSPRGGPTLARSAAGTCSPRSSVHISSGADR